ncbi:30S ribosome-binding factor RbfA [Synechococcus sp. RSCCF101]|uniref:30S ribosome-binding factor RbfA n=1 Tax=Synechococcus sp. RSCCF101 TaxID=2511069 RepID=UPI00124408F2|nr:30S ribosome-binding factor RbfA [Synechococcus sp. RSCCF101]QEY32918.1 30S ribosome-binding factor RbfA [Synechococcus sp. RSCCF101]
MAPQRRSQRVAALIRREVSDMLINGIRDDRVRQGMVSLTDVQVAGDLQHCRIHVSIYGDGADREAVMEGLRSAAGYVRGELGRRLQLRRAPEVVFRLDRGLEQGSDVLGLLGRLERERDEKAGAPAAAEPEPAEPDPGS